MSYVFIKFIFTIVLPIKYEAAFGIEGQDTWVAAQTKLVSFTCNIC